MKYCQLAIFTEYEIEIQPQVILEDAVNCERFYFPVVIWGSSSLHWTLAFSKAEAISMHTCRNSHLRIWVDDSTWGIKTEQGYLFCFI
jgi:hypothetical protein